MRIALITEGISEYRVLKHILIKYFKEYDIEINQIQPRLVHERQEGTGGWVEVLRYCGRREISDILVENDYLIIQIDTDNSRYAPFGIEHARGSVRKTELELCEEVEAKLEGLIQPDILEASRDRILFAVCVHTIECWLMTIFKKNGTSNCLESLKVTMAQEKMPRIESEKNSPKSRIGYEAILRKWSKRQEIERSAALRPSFGVFVNKLALIKHDRSA